jgi:hypothetical protein
MSRIKILIHTAAMLLCAAARAITMEQSRMRFPVSWPSHGTTLSTSEPS